MAEITKQYPKYGTGYLKLGNLVFEFEEREYIDGNGRKCNEVTLRNDDYSIYLEKTGIHFIPECHHKLEVRELPVYYGTAGSVVAKATEPVECDCGAVGEDGTFESGNGRANHSNHCAVWK
jgi:hypothetical protein